MRVTGNVGLANMRGFTLVEVCIVTIISGFLFVAIFDIYARYAQQQTFDTTFYNEQKLSSEISTFRGRKQRYPCPSDRSLKSSDPNFGVEVAPGANKCDLTTLGFAIPLPAGGACYSKLGGIVSPAGTNGVGGVCAFNCSSALCGDKTGVANNIVVIGGVPIATIRGVNGATANGTSIMYDGWGNQLDYVVTYKLTNKNTYRFDRGAITVHDENGNDTGSIVSNGHFGLISHGKDMIGGYTRNGQMTGICGTHVPQSYNTGDDQNCSNNATFIAGIRNESRTALHYDDIVYFSTVKTGGLWVNLPNGSPDMMNVNPGIVNVGTDGVAAPPVGNVALNIGDPAGGTAGVVKAASTAKAKALCDKDGTNCFDVTAVTNPAGCPKIACAAGQVMTGITTDNVTNACCLTPPCTHATCSAPTFKPAASITDQSCHGKWLLGLATDGTIICEP